MMMACVYAETKKPKNFQVEKSANCGLVGKVEGIVRFRCVRQYLSRMAWSILARFLEDRVENVEDYMRSVTLLSRC